MKIEIFILAILTRVYSENTTTSSLINASDTTIGFTVSSRVADTSQKSSGMVNLSDVSDADLNNMDSNGTTNSVNIGTSPLPMSLPASNTTQVDTFDIVRIITDGKLFTCERTNATKVTYKNTTVEATTVVYDITTVLNDSTSVSTENSLLTNPNWTCTTNETDEDYEDYYLYRDYPEYLAGMAIFKYVSPVVLVVGVIFNILSFIVLTLTNMRKTSASLYLAVLAVSDSVDLLMILTNQWLTNSFQIRYRRTNEALCRISLFLAYFLPHLSAWLLVAVTAERVVMVMFPIQARDWCTLKTAVINILILTAVMFLLNMHIFFVSGSGQIMWGNVLYDVNCYSYNDDKHYHWKQNIWPWVDLAFAALIPFTLILICNIVIIATISKAQERRKATMNVQDEKDDAMRSMTIMLIAVSLTFVILTLPITVYYILDGQITGDNPYSSHQHVADLTLLRSCATQLFFINCGINFLLYCVTGKRFRTELVKLFCCRRTAARHVPGTTGVTYITSDSKSGSQATSFTTIENKTVVSLVENGGAPKNNSNSNKDENTKF